MQEKITVLLIKNAFGTSDIEYDGSAVIKNRNSNPSIAVSAQLV